MYPRLESGCHRARDREARMGVQSHGTNPQRAASPGRSTEQMQHWSRALFWGTFSMLGVRGWSEKEAKAECTQSGSGWRISASVAVWPRLGKLPTECESLKLGHTACWQLQDGSWTLAMLVQVPLRRPNYGDKGAGTKLGNKLARG